jgi:UDP-N-acetyl-D-glucosamine dehydrogenase
MGFIDRIEDKSAVIGVVGLGYVGLPLVREFVRAGYRGLGFDTDQSKVEKLNAGESYILSVSSETVGQWREKGRFEATADMNRLSEPDALLICVPTPLTTTREPDLQYVEQTGEAIGRALRKGQLVVLESTTYPGTTAEVLLPMLESLSDLKCGCDFYLAYSPEREDPGNPKFSTGTTPKVVGADDAESLSAARAMYSRIVPKVVEVSSTYAAESVKLLENIFRAVNIALVNELKMLSDRMGMDVWEIIKAAESKPFGFMPFYPGPGLGGHCIPIDPFYLTWKAREYGMPTRFVELAGEINSSMPRYVLSRVMEALNEQGKALKGANVLLVGVTYKPNVDDMRESPALEIMELLGMRGAEISYHDPFYPQMRGFRKYDVHFDSVSLDREHLKAADCVLIVTNHSNIDYQLIVDAASLVVDTRNACAGVSGKATVVKA